jgi:hypothetical protein
MKDFLLNYIVELEENAKERGGPQLHLEDLGNARQQQPAGCAQMAH